MSLDVIHANAKTAAINDAFATIGIVDDTKMPRSKRNDEPLAWQYHVASHLARLAKARKKKAHVPAVRTGVLFDHEKQPPSVGSNALIYAGDVVEISVGVTTPTARLDTVAFIDDLERAGVVRKLLDKLAAKHTTESRAPHKFTSTLVTG